MYKIVQNNMVVKDAAGCKSLLYKIYINHSALKGNIRSVFDYPKKELHLTVTFPKDTLDSVTFDFKRNASGMDIFRTLQSAQFYSSNPAMLNPEKLDPEFREFLQEFFKDLSNICSKSVCILDSVLSLEEVSQKEIACAFLKAEEIDDYDECLAVELASEILVNRVMSLLNMDNDLLNKGGEDYYGKE